MPPRLIEDEHRVRARTDLLRDFSEMQAHRSAVASWHDEPRTLAITRTDRAENVGGGGALIVTARARLIISSFGINGGKPVSFEIVRAAGSLTLARRRM